MTFSSDLIYDVLRKYERDHILLRSTQSDSTPGPLDTARLGLMLKRGQGRLDYRLLFLLSSLALPLMPALANPAAPHVHR